jgi:hypothetical protein
MRTDDLIDMLARGETSTVPNATSRRFSAAIALGLLATGTIMAFLYGMRTDIASAVETPIFWGKLILPALAASASAYMASRLARPGARVGTAPMVLVLLFLAMWALGAAVLFDAPRNERSDLLFGDSWLYCLVTISLLSIPTLITAMWAMKGLSPTRLRLAGGAAGLLAGSVSATVYALHCPEVGVPFLVTWYVLGMLVPAALGGAIGPYALRW